MVLKDGDPQTNYAVFTDGKFDSDATIDALAILRVVMFDDGDNMNLYLNKNYVSFARPRLNKVPPYDSRHE